MRGLFLFEDYVLAFFPSSIYLVYVQRITYYTYMYLLSDWFFLCVYGNSKHGKAIYTLKQNSH